MLETVYKEIINKNTFVIHFIDKSKDGISPDQSDEIHKYQTGDGSEFKMGLRVNAMPKSVLIDLQIKYPLNFYNPNFHELIKGNEKRFQDYYNEIMNYNQTSYNEISDSNEHCEVKSK